MGVVAMWLCFGLAFCIGEYIGSCSIKVFFLWGETVRGDFFPGAFFLEPENYITDNIICNMIFLMQCCYNYSVCLFIVQNGCMRCMPAGLD